MSEAEQRAREHASIENYIARQKRTEERRARARQRVLMQEEEERAEAEWEASSMGEDPRAARDHMEDWQIARRNERIHDAYVDELLDGDE